jgi:hypothetical protein
VAASVSRLGRVRRPSPRRACDGLSLLSRMIREVVPGLSRTTLRGLVIEEHRRPGVELVPDLPDFRGERDVLEAIVGAFAGHEGFDDAAQGVRTEHAVGNQHGHEGSFLSTALRHVTQGGAGMGALAVVATIKAALGFPALRGRRMGQRPVDQASCPSETSWRLGRCPSRLISLAHLSHEHRDAQPFARGFAREGLLPTLWHMAVLILRAALDPATASRAKKGEFVTCFDQFDLLQTAIN